MGWGEGLSRLHKNIRLLKNTEWSISTSLPPRTTPHPKPPGRGSCDGEDPSSGEVPLTRLSFLGEGVKIRDSILTIEDLTLGDGTRGDSGARTLPVGS